MNTKQIIDEMEKELLQYSSGGYSGGKDGLRCFECDRKYSGEASYGQLCAVCNFHSYASKLIESVAEEMKYIVALHRLSAWSPQDKDLELISKGSKTTADAITDDIDLKVQEIINQISK